MINKLIILSDIHGNLSALNSVIEDFKAKNYHPDAIAILGDNINYGMRPNEVISRLKELSTEYNVIANLWGNHEKALLDGDTSRFSTERGKQILVHTRQIMSQDSINYLQNLTKEGITETVSSNRRILFVHGSINDPYWGKLNKETINDPKYAKYDYVISGHSHIPDLSENFFDTDCPEYRNKKRTIFLNPGSIGQPRNHNPRAQYLYLQLQEEIFHFNSIQYSIESERNLFNADVDKFYSDRLIKGI